MIGLGPSLWPRTPYVGAGHQGVRMSCDFTTGLAVLNEQVVPMTDVFQCTRSTEGRLSDGTVFAPNALRRSSRGLLIEEARENFMLNSFSPVDQTINLAAGTYTLSVGAGGSVTLSGAVIAAATSQSSDTFTLAVSGDVDVAISGSPLWVQLEEGAFASSPISADGTSSTRAYDRIQPIDLSWFTPENMTLSIEWEQRQSGSFASNGVSNVIRWAGSAGYSRIRAGSTTFAQIRNELGVLGLNSGVGGATVSGVHTMTLTSTAAELKIDWSDSFNGSAGSASSLDGPAASHVSSMYLGGNAGGEFINGWIRKISLT